MRKQQLELEQKSDCLEENGKSKNGVKNPKVFVDVGPAKSVKSDKKNVDSSIGPAIGQSVQMIALKRSNDGVRANSGGKVQPLGETNAHALSPGDIDGNEAEVALGMQAPMNGSAKQPFKESDWTGCPIMRLDNPHGYVTKPMDTEAKKDGEKKHKHVDGTMPPPNGAATPSSSSTWRPPSYWAPLNFRRFGPQLLAWCISGGSHAMLLWLFRLLFVDLSLTLFLVFMSLSLGEIIFQQALIWYASRSLICGIEADCRVFVLSHVLRLSPEQTSGSRGLGYACNYLPMVYRDCAQFLVQQVCPSVGSMVTTLILLAKTSPLYPLPFLLTAVLGMVWTDARQHIIARAVSFLPSFLPSFVSSTFSFSFCTCFSTCLSRSRSR